MIRHFLCLFFLALTSAQGFTAQEKPNVLFLAVDDMKDWVGCLGGYEGTVHTPHIDRLAERGVLFTNAHCPSPLCAPSRAAIMLGQRPSTTGLYDNGQWWYANYPDKVSLPLQFRHQGYYVAGAGKLFHHTAGNTPPNQWDDFQRLLFRNDPWFRGVKKNYPWSESGPNPDGFPFSGVEGLGHENDWGSLGIPETDYDDTLSANYAIEFLGKEHGQPFFLACGIFRPHLPWYVPQSYFDLYPIEDVVLPQILDTDLDDVPEAGLKIAASRRGDLEKIRAADKHREAVRAYLASISYADAQLGRVLDALDARADRDRTIIVLWSDHGWHLGEKDHWHKSTLWEEATRVPLIIAAPGVTPAKSPAPVSLLDLYPTLIELCGLEGPDDLDGKSLVPLLQNPLQGWDRPAIIEYGRGNAAVRSTRYRYIRYADGSEELYDLAKDPLEWHNLAGKPGSQSIQEELAPWIPQNWAEPALSKSAFTFDPETYQWTHKKSGTVTSGAR